MQFLKDIPLDDILQNIKASLDDGYELEISIDYNEELKDLPKDKLYKFEEVKNMDYISFISEIYNHFRSIERQELYEFQARLERDEDNTNFHYSLTAMRPFRGDAGYKRGGGSETFSMRVFLTQRNLLLHQIYDLHLPTIYEDIGTYFIKNEHPYYLDNLKTVTGHIKNTIYENIIGKIIEDKYYAIEQREITLEELKESTILNINTNNYELVDFEITIKESYGSFYFSITNKYLGDIIKLTQRKEVTTEYLLDITT